MTGKVWLVGAGPSDEGLLTVRGSQVLSQAQVVVYDALVGPGILNLIPTEAERISVGKRAGRHTMPQEEINRVLYEKAREGKRVVRLKGGDPFLFGRGGEELELLSARGIPFEVVPGVTSALAVPAYNGIPVTHRDCVSSLHIVTGHKRAGEAYRIDFEALVRTGGTLVFLMGHGALPEICQGLLAAGIDPDLPAALLMEGTTANQRRIVATVSTLAKEAAKQETATPAIILVGRVCSYEKQFSWYEKLPLSGHRIIVTRPRERSGQLSGRLRQLGAEVLELPAIATVPRRVELPKIEKYNKLVFTSPAGVRIFLDCWRKEGRDIRSLGAVQIAVIGPGTAQELAQRGIFADLMPEIYDGEHLGILLGEVCGDGDRILIPRAREGNPQLLEEIRKRKKVEITDLALYDTVYGEAREGLVDQRALIEAGRISMAVFTSASTVRGFALATEGLDYSLVRAVCIGRQTAAAAGELGMRTYVARQAALDSLVECVLKTAARKDS